MGAYYSDTHPKIEQMQIEMIRKMPSWKKFAAVDDLKETVKAFALSGIKQRHPGTSAEQIQRMLADIMLGPEFARKVYDHASDAIRMTLLVTDVFERLGIPYVVSGSMSSSVHGIMRSTMDVDIVADMRLEHIAEFVAALSTRICCSNPPRYSLEH